MKRPPFFGRSAASTPTPRWNAWEHWSHYERTGDPAYVLRWLDALTRAGVRITLSEQIELLAALRTAARKRGRRRRMVERDYHILQIITILRRTLPDRTLDEHLHNAARVFRESYAVVKDVWHDEQKRLKQSRGNGTLSLLPAVRIGEARTKRRKLLK
jgi:hypothetical protein